MATLLSASVAACNLGPADPLADDSTAEFSTANCPSSAFTGMTCIESQQGGPCPGTRVCNCGDFTSVTLETTCECVGDGSDKQFECNDSCEGACEGPATSTFDGPAAIADVCARLSATDCPGDFTYEMDACVENYTRYMPCPEFEELMRCGVDAPIVCVDLGEIDQTFKGVWAPTTDGCGGILTLECALND